MTAGLSCLHELRDALLQLTAGEAFAWQRIGGNYDLLRRALVETVRGREEADPAPLLDQCWQLLNDPQCLEQITRFHRLDPHYAGVNVASSWLHRNACALMATARTAVAAQHRDLVSLMTWAGVAAELLGHRGDSISPEMLDRTSGPPAALVDEAFRVLAEHGWRAQGARVWTHSWLPRPASAKASSSRRRSRSRRPGSGVLGGPALRVPVSGCFDGTGFLADLCLFRLGGAGELVPHPDTALQPLGAHLLGGLEAAWESSRQSVCFTFGVRDATVPSWVPLEGTSLSGAAAVGFELLARGQSGVVRRVIVAHAAADGRLEPVGHEKEKMQAAFEGDVPSVVLAHDSHVRETCIERYRQSGQEVVRASSLSEVFQLPERPPAKAEGGGRKTLALGLVALLLGAGAGTWRATTSGHDGRCPATASPERSLEVAGVWTDNEQEAFLSVLREFCRRTGIVATYTRTPTIMMAKYLDVQCTPPDVAMVAQPGLLRQLAANGRLIPLGPEPIASLEKNYAQANRDVGVAPDGQQYGVFFKASNKSLWWYSVPGLKKAGVAPPTTLDQLLETAKRVTGVGMPWLAIGAEDGWPLTDLFENIYLRTAGKEKYDLLAAHRLPWDDPTVVYALRVMDRVLGDDRQFPDGTSGAMATDWRMAVLEVLGGRAMTTFEGDFVGAYAVEKAPDGPELGFFDFPSVDGSGPAVIGGGDIGVALTAKPAAQKLLAFLASPEAASVWVRRSGFTSPNRNVKPSVYPDDLTRRAAQTLASTELFRFDLSDQQPTSFGATKQTGMLLRFQQFLVDRDPVKIAAALEDDASKTSTTTRVEPGSCPPRSTPSPASVPDGRALQLFGTPIDRYQRPGRERARR